MKTEQADFKTRYERRTAATTSGVITSPSAAASHCSARERALEAMIFKIALFMAKTFQLKTDGDERGIAIHSCRIVTIWIFRSRPASRSTEKPLIFAYPVE